MLSVTAQIDTTVCQVALHLLTLFIGSHFTIPIGQARTAPSSFRGHSLCSHFYWAGTSASRFSIRYFFRSTSSCLHSPLSLVGLIALRLLHFLFPNYPAPSHLQPHPPFQRLAETQFPLSYYSLKHSEEAGEKKGARRACLRAGVKGRNAGRFAGTGACAQARGRPLARSRREGASARERQG